jgi:hypothetical protein
MKTYVIRKINTALNIGGLKIMPNVLQVGDSNFTDLKNETKWKIR